MKIQLLPVLLILSLLVFENYLLAASKRKTKQVLLIENARLTAENHRLKGLTASASGIAAPVTISEDGILSEGDVELGISSRIVRRRTSSLSAENKDEVNFHRSITDVLTTQTHTQSMQSHTQNTITQVLEKNIQYQQHETKYNRRTRMITWLATGATVIYTTAGFVMTNWSRISTYFSGGHHGAPGSGTNSTGV